MSTQITELLHEYPLTTYAHRTATAINPIMYGLIRIPSSAWPDPKLGAILRQIHPLVRIVINPDKII